jgi:hypothetical protein
MQNFHKKRYWYITAVVMVSMLLIFLPPAATLTDENPEVQRLLEQARDKAAELAKDADDMEALTRTDASWQSHATMLEDVKEHVNELGRIAEKLNTMRSSASPWQQQAIDRMIPLLKELASNTTAEINHLNENQIRPVSGNYPEYLKENSDTAHQLASTISTFVQYGQSRARLEKLEQKLEIARK